MKRKDEKVMSEKFNVADIFGENVFNDTVMKERLPKNVYKNLKLAIAGVQELNITDADVIANAMKNWAIEKGATHYTHWFQPLTGTTAEKLMIHLFQHLMKMERFLWNSLVKN